MSLRFRVGAGVERAVSSFSLGGVVGPCFLLGVSSEGFQWGPGCFVVVGFSWFWV